MRGVTVLSHSVRICFHGRLNSNTLLKIKYETKLPEDTKTLVLSDTYIF